MTKKGFKWLIVLTALSLLGVIFMQLYWIRNALFLREEQFSARVDLAAKMVVNRLMDIKPNNESKVELATLNPLNNTINTALLDSLLRMELGCLRVSGGYHYAVYKRTNSELIMGNVDELTNELLFSRYQQSLEAITNSADYYLTLYFPAKKSSMWMWFFWWLLLSALFSLAVVLSFYYTVRTAWRQKRLSEIKSDFINNMTHEFKTPIATISIASEMLLREEVNADTHKTIKYAHIILNENQRLQKMAEQVLQSASLEKSDMKLSLRQIDMNELIREVADSFHLRIEEKNGVLNLDLEAENPLIWVDPNQMAYALTNLLDNAVKYSPDKLSIKLQSWTESDKMFIRIQDQGIGISGEDQKHIFKNLYRIPTGNRHDVKGFGIGLFYVEKVILAHGGKIVVDSLPSKGTKFTITLPIEKQNLN